MMNNVAFNELRYRRETEPPEPLTRDRGLLDGFWESYPAMSPRSPCSPRSWCAVLQAEHREDSVDSSQTETDTVDVEVAHEFIRSVVEQVTT